MVQAAAVVKPMLPMTMSTGRQPPRALFRTGVRKKMTPMMRSMAPKTTPVVTCTLPGGDHCWMMSALGDWLAMKLIPRPTRPTTRMAKFGAKAWRRVNPPMPKKVMKATRQGLYRESHRFEGDCEEEVAEYYGCSEPALLDG